MSGVVRFLKFETFTGWHMVAVMVLFFGTIISVNVTMAYYAGSSWSGLIVENTYVASQKFDDDVAQNREMESRGWTSEVSVDEDRIVYRLTDATGTPVVADTVTMSLHRPVGIEDDRTVILANDGEGGYRAREPIADGLWIARLTVEQAGSMVYRDTQRLQFDAPGTGE